MVEDSKSGALRLVQAVGLIATALHASAALAQTPPPAAPPVQTQDALCVPACRNGFTCVSGGCVSACNPPCPEGSTCTDERTCVSLAPTYHTPPPAAPPTYAPPPATPGYYAAPPSAHDSAERKERLDARTTPRLTLHLVFDLSDFETSYSRANSSGTLSEEINAPLSTYGIGAAAGYRQNFSQLVGISARVGAGYGVATGYTTFAEDEVDSSALGTATSFYGDLGVHFNPAWRFYVGPLAWFSHTSFSPSTETIDGEDFETTFDESSLSCGGAGVDAGILLLPREQLDLNLRVKLDTDARFHVQFAVGWAFVLGG